MTGGFEWNEITAAGYSEWILSDDHLGFILGRPLVAEPGSTFTYNSAATYLLGVVVEEATGVPLPEFAAERLFAPAGIQVTDWEELPGNSDRRSA